MEDLSTYKVADLRRELKSRGLNSNGSKTELLTRLQTVIATEKSGLEDPTVMDDSLIDEDSMLEDEEDESGSDVDSNSSNDADVPVNLSSSPVKLSESKDGALQPPVSVVTTTPTANKSLPVEKSQNGTEDSGIPAKKKKITISRLPVKSTPQTSGDPNVDSGTSDGTDDKSAKDVLVKEKGVVKINAVTSAADKLVARQKKFGSSLETVTNNSKTEAVTKTPIPEKLQKRAERFGSASSTGSIGGGGKISLTTEEEAKLAKRRERFGIQLPEEKNAVVNAAKEKRSARFGSSVTGTGAVVSSVEVEEKKLKRAARFNTTT